MLICNNTTHLHTRVLGRWHRTLVCSLSSFVCFPSHDVPGLVCGSCLSLGINCVGQIPRGYPHSQQKKKKRKRKTPKRSAHTHTKFPIPLVSLWINSHPILVGLDTFLFKCLLCLCLKLKSYAYGNLIRADFWGFHAYWPPCMRTMCSLREDTWRSASWRTLGYMFIVIVVHVGRVVCFCAKPHGSRREPKELFLKNLIHHNGMGSKHPTMFKFLRIRQP